MTKKLSVNLAVFAASLVFMLAFMEFVVFRFVLVASDIPRLDYVNGVVRYAPGQRGVYRVKNDVKARYSINENGWNSRHGRYDTAKAPGKFRIAVIGDSLVEALQVDYDRSFAEKLEDRLGPERCEVYRFGIGGAPMTQYLHVLRNEVERFGPDLVVVVLVHNDFDESYTFSGGAYSSSFLKLKIAGTGGVEEIQPVKYGGQAWWFFPLRNSATFRYLRFRRKVDFVVAAKEAMFGRDKKVVYRANIRVDRIKENLPKSRIAAGYVLENIKEICGRTGSGLLVVMDGDRKSIGEVAGPAGGGAEGPLLLNELARSVSEEKGIDFIDLHPVFDREYRERGKLFYFESDMHWNDYGHEIVAETLKEYMEKKNYGKE